jgi:chromosome segregation ATPase
MKILELRAENYKKIKVVEIKPDPTLNILSGANAAGKSSVLDAIWSALDVAEMKRATATTEPIRQGQEKATVMLDLGDYKVTRSWTKTGSTVTVEGAGGAVYKSPQALLDGLIGKISLDPLAFAAADDKKQRETLLSFVKIGIDLEKNKIERDAVFAGRTQVNREIKALENVIAAMPPVPAGTPEAETSAAEVIKAQQDAAAMARENERQRMEFSRKKEMLAKSEADAENGAAIINELKARIQKEEAALASLCDQITAKKEEMKKEAARIVSLTDPDLSVFAAQLNKLEATNKNVRALAEKRKALAELNTKKTAADAMTAKIESLDKEKTAAVASAAFPVPGLSVNDESVVFNGVPFGQCSSAEKLRVSIAVAMAISPRLRVIRIADGSLIDSANMAAITDLAKKNDYQLWIERVDESGKVGIYLEDGEVKAAAPSAKE